MPHPNVTAPEKIADIDWSQPKTEALFSEMEKPENRVVLFGKQRGENSTNDNKNAVHKRIAAKVVPDVYAINATTAANRVKAKIDALTRAYTKAAKTLHQTGGGLVDGEILALPLIEGDAPDESTPEAARNLWDAIVQRYHWFPAMWRLKHERANTIPPAISTGMGPQGPYTTFYQVPPPDRATDNGAVASARAAGAATNIDPSLVDRDNMPPASQTGPNNSGGPEFPWPPPRSPSPSQADRAPAPLPAPAPVAAPAPATNAPGQDPRLVQALESAKGKITPVTGKRGGGGWQDTFIETNQETLSLVRERMKADQEDKRARLALDKGAALMKEFQLGLITRKEYRDRAGLPKEHLSPSPARRYRDSSTSSPRRSRSRRDVSLSPAKSNASSPYNSPHRNRSRRQPSPEWVLDENDMPPIPAPVFKPLDGEQAA